MQLLIFKHFTRMCVLLEFLEKRICFRPKTFFRDHLLMQENHIIFGRVYLKESGQTYAKFEQNFIGIWAKFFVIVGKLHLSKLILAFLHLLKPYEGMLIPAMITPIKKQILFFIVYYAVF